MGVVNGDDTYGMRSRARGRVVLVSFPDPHVLPPERGSGMGFLGIAESRFLRNSERLSCALGVRADSNASIYTWQLELEPSGVPVRIEVT